MQVRTVARRLRKGGNPQSATINCIKRLGPHEVGREPHLSFAIGIQIPIARNLAVWPKRPGHCRLPASCGGARRDSQAFSLAVAAVSSAGGAP